MPVGTISTVDIHRAELCPYCGKIIELIPLSAWKWLANEVGVPIDYPVIRLIYPSSLVEKLKDHIPSDWKNPAKRHMLTCDAPFYKPLEKNR